MGQCLSVPNQKLSLMGERSSQRFYRSRAGNLSATFHFLDPDMKWDLLNINTATEEQLMTLPGINRSTAENIVEYRQRIGGFKKVEDLALVSGVGATKLEQFRTEISVGRRKDHDSSVYHSADSLQFDNSSRSSPSKIVNVNSANVFQLMSICRMTQEMAANIVHFRERKGPFKTLDDLSKVKGLPPDRLAVVKMYLTLDPSAALNCTSSSHNKLPNDINNRLSLNHRRTNSAPCGLGKSRSCDANTRQFYELVSSCITRPIANKLFDSSFAGKSVLRISSWNLQKFTLDKAKNPGVQEVICRTILENGFSLVAVQEVESKDALSLIATELNDPKLYNVQTWEGERGKWHTLTPPLLSPSDKSSKKILMNGFLYDTSHGLQLKDSTILYLPPETLAELKISCQPFLGWFRIDNLDFIVVTFSLISESCVSKLLPVILELLKEKIPGEKNVFLMGDFILPPGHTVFEVLNSQGYSHLISVGDVSDDFLKEEKSHLWSSINIRKIFTGRSGIVTEGLNHLAIPHGWKWGGSVSDHCPVWVEVFTEEHSAKSVPVTNGFSKMTIATDNTSSSENSDSIKTETRSGRKNKGFWDRCGLWKSSSKNTLSEMTDNAKDSL